MEVIIAIDDLHPEKGSISKKTSKFHSTALAQLEKYQTLNWQGKILTLPLTLKI